MAKTRECFTCLSLKWHAVDEMCCNECSRVLNDRWIKTSVCVVIKICAIVGSNSLFDSGSLR